MSKTGRLNNTVGLFCLRENGYNRNECREKPANSNQTMDREAENSVYGSFIEYSNLTNHSRIRKYLLFHDLDFGLWIIASLAIIYEFK